MSFSPHPTSPSIFQVELNLFHLNLFVPFPLVLPSFAGPILALVTATLDARGMLVAGSGYESPDLGAVPRMNSRTCGPICVFYIAAGISSTAISPTPLAAWIIHLMSAWKSSLAATAHACGQ
ncbi:hypothetical protein C8R44DRAFT_323508 [Mycena epipterygia]|nr:hypothetical protein C8R44DRAFT_323508 [Mycena epipterygia]